MTFKLRDGVSAADTDYGITLLDEDSGQYWNLNPTAALALRTLLDGGTPAQAVQELTEQYAVDADTASRDVEALVGELRSAGLVKEQPRHEHARSRLPPAPIGAPAAPGRRLPRGGRRPAARHPVPAAHPHRARPPAPRAPGRPPSTRPRRRGTPWWR